MQNKLTIITPVHNDYKTIEASLSSTAWADELLIIDDQSDKDFIDICRKYTSTIYSRKLDTFTSQWDYAISKVRNKWVLIIASDEIVTEALAKEIKKAIQSNEIAGYHIYRKDFMFGKWIRYGGFYHSHLRLFQKDQCSWNKRLVHEALETKGRVKKLKNHVLHFSYKKINETILKYNRYADMEAQEKINDHEAKNTMPSSFSLFFKMFYYGTKESIGLLILKRGYKDGLYGFIMCFIKGFYYFLIYSKVYEWAYKKKNKKKIMKELKKYNLPENLYF